MSNFTLSIDDIQVAAVSGWLISRGSDRKTYALSIELLRKAINRAKLGIRGKNEVVGGLDRVRC